MGDIRVSANGSFREFVTDGVPASGEHDPVKSEIRATFGVIEDRVEEVETLASAGVSWTANTIRVRSTANVTIASGLENGDTLNGVTLATGDHVFLAYQTAPAENGIYTVVASGAASRATFADSAAELARIGFYIAEGTDGAGEQWTLSKAAADITLGTTALNFSRLSPAPGYAAEVITARGSEASLDARITAVDDKVRIGTSNVSVGTGAGEDVTTATELTAIGKNAAANVTTGVRNTALGEDALRACTTGDNQTAIGRAALNGVTTGSENVALGTAAGSGAGTSSARNIFIGPECGLASIGQATPVTNSVAIGRQAHTTKNFQFVLGSSEYTETVLFGDVRAGHGGAYVYRFDAADENYFFADAGPSTLPTGTGNVAIGKDAGDALTTCVASVFVGKDAGKAVTTGLDMTFIGAGAGLAQVSGVGCTAVGRLAGKTSTAGTNWTAIGDTALEFNTVDSCVAVGYGAGRDQSTGVGGIYLGTYAGGYSADADHTTVVGTEALGGSSYGDDNTIGGWRAGHVMTGARNTGWGSEALRSNTTGSDNTAFGFRAGFQVTTGTSNTFLGRSAGHDASQKVDAVNSMALGALTYTTKSNQVVIGNSSVTEFVLGGVTITTAQLTALLALL